MNDHHEQQSFVQISNDLTPRYAYYLSRNDARQIW